MSKRPLNSLINSKTKFIITGIPIENYDQDEFLLSRFKADTKLFIDEIIGNLNQIPTFFILNYLDEIFIVFYNFSKEI
jgi:hypothetical protein